MPFPAFDYCIICEGIRPEVGGKLTILGFYGVCPNVEVAIANPSQSLMLAFIAGFPPVLDQSALYQNTISILRPNGTPVFQTPQQQLRVSAVGRGIVGSNFVIKPPYVWGDHIIQIHVNREVKLAATFRVRQASTAELSGLPGALIPPPAGMTN